MGRVGALLLLVVVAGGCDGLDPQVGPPVAARCVDGDGEPGTAVSFTRDLQPILELRCKTCHTPGGAAPLGLQITGLDLSSRATILAGATAGAVVVPGQPCGSLLYQKVSEGPPFGSRMPLNGPPFLTEAQLALIHDWIAEGALAN